MTYYCMTRLVLAASVIRREISLLLLSFLFCHSCADRNPFSSPHAIHQEFFVLARERLPRERGNLLLIRNPDSEPGSPPGNPLARAPGAPAPGARTADRAPGLAEKAALPVSANSARPGSS